MSTRARLKTAVAARVGLPMWSSGRAADLQWFQFGERRTVTTHTGRLGKTKEVGAYALHVQCPWRIVRDDEVVVGRGDLYTPADETEDTENFDWGGSVTLSDRRVAEWMAQHDVIKVARVDVGDGGVLRVVFEAGSSLEMFPFNSVAFPVKTPTR